MFEFVPAIRTDRYREIRAYKEKEFSFIKENDYQLINKVKIRYSDNNFYEFEVRVNFNDVKFYIINNSSAIYLSIYQLYELFHQILLESKVDVVLQLKQLLKKKKKQDFLYNGIEYKVPKTRKFSQRHKVYIPDSNMNISYNELFYLLVLIQTKSNYFFSISGIKKDFSNGIIRLFIALLSVKNNNKILNNNGWKFDKEKNIFEPNKLEKIKKQVKNSKKHNEKVERKYYLTETELKSIIKLRS